MAEELLAMHMRYEAKLLIAVNFALFLNLAGLLFAISADPYVKKRHRRYLVFASFLVFTLVIQTQLDNYLGLNKISLTGRTLAAMYGYQVRPIVLAMFIQITEMDKKHKWIWWAVLANALIYATALFSGISFYFQADFTFRRGPLGYTCHVVSLALLFYLLELSVKRVGQYLKMETIIPIGIALVIAVAVLADIFFGTDQWISYLSVAMVGGCTFYYVWLHTQFTTEYERALLAEQRIQVMIAQTQPHFLYNVLPTIQKLCKVDPVKAYQAAERFHVYLLQNNEYLQNTGMIPFRKELEHMSEYVEIEKMQYPNVQMELDLRVEDFQLPALSLQPVVEEAFCHGIGELEKGVIRVTTSLEGDVYEVIIWDNGRRVDASAESTKLTYHIGMKDIAERLKEMCGGTVESEGFVGEGTIVTIRIPKK